MGEDDVAEMTTPAEEIDIKDVYKGPMINVVEESRKGLISNQRVSEMLEVLGKGGVVMVESAFPRFAMYDSGKLEFGLPKEPETEVGVIHELVHAEQWLGVFREGITPEQFMQWLDGDDSGIAEVLAEISAYRVQLEQLFFRGIAEGEIVEELRRRVGWGEEIVREAGYEVPEDIKNPYCDFMGIEHLNE
ncbi:MAG: hypothetical protein WC841_04385 [Candidatus Shapirobacteria bacterium]|jgi:hypothetical protein